MHTHKNDTNIFGIKIPQKNPEGKTGATYEGLFYYYVENWRFQ